MMTFFLENTFIQGKIRPIGPEWTQIWLQRNRRPFFILSLEDTMLTVK